MTLAFPTNIAARENAAQIVGELMRSLRGPLAYHVCDGKPVEDTIESAVIESISRSFAECSLVYILEGSRGGRFEPIAAFICNEDLGRAQLWHLVDMNPNETKGKLPRPTVDLLGVYVRSMLSEVTWLNAVTVPAVMDSLDGFAGLKVAATELSTITLADASHRPNSSRRRISDRPGGRIS